MGTTLAGTECLVMGAGGFIGLNLCGALVNAGASVHGYGRSVAFPDALPSIRWTTAQSGDSAAVARALKGVQVVFHLLGGSIPAIAERRPVDDLRTNATTSVELLELCRAAGVRRIVFISSGGTVYGVPRRLPIAEDHPTDRFRLTASISCLWRSTSASRHIATGCSQWCFGPQILTDPFRVPSVARA